MKKLFRFLVISLSLLLCTCTPDNTSNGVQPNIDAITHHHDTLDEPCGNHITREEQIAFEQSFLRLQVEAKEQPDFDARVNLSKTIVIPVIVHVVYNEEEENISDAQIHSQIDALNRDFGFLNSDKVNIPDKFKKVAGDFNLEFKLIKQDLNGNPVDAITRTETSMESFGHEFENVKYTAHGGHDVFLPQQVLNIWVCDLQGGLLGYAQFPGDLLATDGVVVDYEAFGQNGTARDEYNKGRVLVHEIGHWLGLYHIWGDDSYWYTGAESCDGSDEIKDTPNSDGPYWGCPDPDHAYSCDSWDMYMNFMDYTDDHCTIMFTEGQVKRGREVLKYYHRDIYKHTKRIKTLLGE